MDCETRLAATIGTQIIAIIEMFTPTNRVQRDPFAFTFQMTVCMPNMTRAASASELMRIARTGEVFQVAVARAEYQPRAQWTLEHVLFERCIITAAAPVSLPLLDSPVKFSGLCHERIYTERAAGGVPLAQGARAG